jgi:HAD superfamily hydrolase (TIGR01509 family)
VTTHAVLLDVDGTLIDSNDAHAKAWVDALGERGYDVSFERIRRLMGQGGDKLLPNVISVSAESELGKSLSERRAEIFLERYIEDVWPFPSTRALLERMRGDGFRLVVATSAQKREMEPLLDRSGVRDLLQRTTSSDDAERSKPDADIIEAALAKAGASAEQAVMLGDTPYDVEAARRASVAVIALRSGGWSNADLAGATAIYADCADLLAHYEASPLGWHVKAMSGASKQT